MLKWIFATLTGMLIMISILLTQLMFNINNSPEDKEPVDPPQYHLQVIIQDTDEYFWTSFKEGAKVAEEELGVYVEFVPISQRNIENLEEAVEIGRIAGVDGIALQAADSEQTLNIIEEARKQGIDIITYENDSYIIPDIPMVGSNSYNIGVSAGDMAVNATNGRGNAVVVINKGEDKNDISYKNLIVQGIVDSFSKYSTINIKKVYTLNKDMFEAEKVASEIIADKSKTDIILCFDEKSTPGIAQVLVDNNFVGDIQLIGYGVMPQTLDYINRGVIYGTVYPNSYDIGYNTVKQLTQMIKGEQISDSISTELYTIDAKNVKEYK